MATVLHLLKGDASPLTRATIEHQRTAGDRVTVVLLEGATAPPCPSGVALHRVPEDVGYDHLIDLVFEADQVIAW
jgi:hypothetical protein